MLVSFPLVRRALTLTLTHRPSTSESPLFTPGQYVEEAQYVDEGQYVGWQPFYEVPHYGGVDAYGQGVPGGEWWGLYDEA